MEQTIEIPADAETVTLKMEKQCSFTLRSLLPQVRGEVELVIVDEFGRRFHSDHDLYRLKANSGSSLLQALERSRIVDGKSLLGLTPSVQRLEPQTSLLNGSVVPVSGTGCIQLWVTPYVPGEED
jgi:hypothetical protein